MLEKYYTPEQMDQFKKRGEQGGVERIRQVEAEWPKLMADVQAEMDKGTDHGDTNVKALARRWAALVHEFTGGDPGITQSLSNLYENEESVAGMDSGALRSMVDYIAKAMSGS